MRKGESVKTIPAIDTNRIPAVLRDAPQWVLWRYEERDGKLTKPPHQTDGSYASHNEPATWAKFERVVKAYERGGFDGIGFVLADMDPFAGVDLDHVFDTDTGEIVPWAQAIIDRLDSYTERSPSGNGIRIFVRGTLPDGFPRGGRKRKMDGDQAVEVYCRLRYLTVTGRCLHGAEVEERGDEFQAICRELFPEVEKREKPAPSSNGSSATLDDAALQREMFNSAAGLSIIRLWNGDITAHNGQDKSHSGADLALCNHLIWWTNGDTAQADRLFRCSKLFRSKWDEAREGSTYGGWTLGLAYADWSTLPEDKRYSGPAGLTFDIDAEPHVVDPGTRSELEQAKDLLNTLAESLKADAGFAYEKQTKLALGCLRALDSASWARARSILRNARVSLRDLEKALPPISYYLPKEVADSDGSSTLYAGDCCPDCPTPTLVIPSPWALSDRELLKKRTTENGKTILDTIAHAPLVIEGRMRDEEERKELLRVAWKRPGSGWTYHVMDRGQAVNAAELIKLANTGLPVATDNAKDLASYLHHLEAANFASIRSARVSSHLGWQGDEGRLGFLWGRQLITPEGEITEPINLERIAPADWKPGWVGFRGCSGGEQIADAYHRRGSFDGQLKLMTEIADYPRVILALYASLSAPLLMILNAPNPIINWANRTSTGKTTALRVAASVWGKPDEKAPDSALTSWEATRVAIERRCSVCSGLPAIFDDSKQAKSNEMIAQTIYQVGSGRGKDRGSTTGMGRTSTWKLAFLSSGEQKLVAGTQDGGTRARALEITGIPFGRDDDEMRKLVVHVNRTVQLHYGHIGPLFVAWLITNRARWPEWVKAYHQNVEAYAAQSESNVGGRLAELAAVIHMAAQLSYECFSFPWEWHGPLDTFWQQMTFDAGVASPEVRALQDVMSWAYSNRSTFIGRREIKNFLGDEAQPNLGWSGRWDDDAEWETIAFIPTVMTRVLEQLKYEPAAIISNWADRGWLQKDGRHLSRKVLIAKGEYARMYVLNRAAVEEVGA